MLGATHSGPEPTAMEQALEIYRRLLGWFTKKTGQHVDARDLTQDVYLSLARMRTRLRPPTVIGLTWKIARARLADYWRRQSVGGNGTNVSLDENDENGDPRDELPRELWDNDTPADALGRKIQRALLESEIAKLTEKIKIVAAKLFLDGYTIKEAARELKMSLNAVKLAKSRALKKLKARVQKLYGDSNPPEKFAAQIQATRQTANSKQQTANSKQQTANSKQQTANSKQHPLLPARKIENRRIGLEPRANVQGGVSPSTSKGWAPDGESSVTSRQSDLLAAA